MGPQTTQRKLDALSFKKSLKDNFGDELVGQTRAIQTNATRIAQKAAELNLVEGRSPVTAAATAIYMAPQASETKKTAKEVGEAAGVSENTIKQYYKLLLPKAKELFPDNFDLELFPSS
uniref:TFIIB domain-containing protein n=1 Tax=Panagrellus redivivus TaxID=6233 RepID=A0A7E4UNB7_PANRE